MSKTDILFTQIETTLDQIEGKMNGIEGHIAAQAKINEVLFKINEVLFTALSDTNALLGAMIMVKPKRDLTSELEQQYNDNLKALAYKGDLE